MKRDIKDILHPIASCSVLADVYGTLCSCYSGWEVAVSDDPDFRVAYGSQEYAASISAAKVNVVEAMRVLGYHPTNDGSAVPL